MFKPDCPVCGSSNTATGFLRSLSTDLYLECNHCGFTDVVREFGSIRDAVDWLRSESGCLDSAWLATSNSSRRKVPVLRTRQRRKGQPSGWECLVLLSLMRVRMGGLDFMASPKLCDWECDL